MELKHERTHRFLCLYKRIQKLHKDALDFLVATIRFEATFHLAFTNPMDTQHVDLLSFQRSGGARWSRSYAVLLVVNEGSDNLENIHQWNRAITWEEPTIKTSFESFAAVRWCSAAQWHTRHGLLLAKTIAGYVKNIENVCHFNFLIQKLQYLWSEGWRVEISICLLGDLGGEAFRQTS